MNDVDDFLEHHGVRGMKWGVHRSGALAGVSKRTSREAHKDANEFAKAKMFYGEGAGNRRKLIKATVEAKARKSPDYKKAFDHHLANQDMEKRASQARSTRKRRDVSKGTMKTARGVHRIFTGGMGSVSLAATVVAGGAVWAHKAGIDKMLLDKAKVGMNEAKRANQRRQAKGIFDQIKDFNG